MELPSIKSLVSGGLKGLLDGAGTIISKFKADPTKVAEFEKEMEELRINSELEANRIALEAERIKNAEIEIYVKDAQDARNSNTKIQESEHASWLAKNTLSILTLLITSGFFGLLSYMLKYDVPTANKDILNIMLGSLGTAWITVVAFYFGSSAGSKANADTIRKIIDKQ